MIKIGQILKSRREELGYTLTKMSEKTKVPILKLQAIEEGNIAYFKDELTYVKFYVRYYFNSLHLNFEDYKELLNESLDEYTQTATLKRIEELDEINTRVKNKVKTIADQNKTKKVIARPKKERKIDFGFVSMFVLSFMILLALIYVFVSDILPLMSKTDDSNQVIVLPDPIIHEGDEEIPVVDPVVPVEKVLKVSMVDATHYDVSGFSTDQDITLVISQPLTSSWLGTKVNDVKIDNPATGFYEKGAVYTFITKAQNDMVIEMLIGWVYNQNMTLNGIPVVIDPSIINSGNKIYFYFTFKGDGQ